MNKRKSLPILNRVSYSYLYDYKLCPWYFRKLHVEKAIPREENTIWTIYGTLVHKYIQDTLDDKIEPEVAAKRFIRTWFKFCGIYKKQLKEQQKPGTIDPIKLYRGPVRAIMTIKEELQKKFGDYEVLAIEHRLLLVADADYSQNFKGFIDIILKVGDKIIIADFKTTVSHYMFKKFRDKWKDYQLSLYKSYYCIEMSIDPKSVETYFITIAKDPKSKAPLEFIRVTSGSVKIKNALKWMRGVLNSLKTEKYMKDRSSCEAFFGKDCRLYHTKHCK